MGDCRMIPQGYITIGEVAREICVTQYYDRKNLQSPSSESEGGHRLSREVNLPAYIL